MVTDNYFGVTSFNVYAAKITTSHFVISNSKKQTNQLESYEQYSITLKVFVFNF